MKRKNFGYITAKIHGGKPGDQTLGIHLKATDKEAFKLALSVMKGIEYGKDIDITVFRSRPLSTGKCSVTITSKI